MRPLRIVSRALLLAAGCAVMLATPPPRPQLSARISTWLPAGAAQTLQFSAPCPGWERLMLYVHPNAFPDRSRLVGFVSPTPPPAEALALLKPGMKFTRGEQLGELGTVAFSTLGEYTITLGKESSHPQVSGPGPFFLTVFAPDAALEPEFAVLAMTGCDSDDKAEVQVLHPVQPTPAGGPDEGGSR